MEHLDEYFKTTATDLSRFSPIPPCKCGDRFRKPQKNGKYLNLIFFYKKACGKYECLKKFQIPGSVGSSSNATPRSSGSEESGSKTEDQLKVKSSFSSSSRRAVESSSTPPSSSSARYVPMLLSHSRSQARILLRRQRKRQQQRMKAKGITCIIFLFYCTGNLILSNCFYRVGFFFLLRPVGPPAEEVKPEEEQEEEEPMNILPHSGLNFP